MSECSQCTFKKLPADGGHCYMFKFKPFPVCAKFDPSIDTVIDISQVERFRMAGKLLERQFEFMQMLPRLIDYAHKLGYQVTVGDAYRDPRAFGVHGSNTIPNSHIAAYGAPKSCHKLRLAVDLNLFKGGQMLSRTVDHEPLGIYWESLGGSWGGRFNDGNHYSLSWEGSK